MDNLSLGTLKGRHLLTELARRNSDGILPALGAYGRVSVVAEPLIAARLLLDGVEGTQLIVRAAGPRLHVGDTVALIPMDDGGIIAVKVGGDESANGWASSFAGSTTPSTTNTATMVEAIGGAFTFGPGSGTWAAIVFGTLRMKHSVAGGNMFIATALDGVNSNLGPGGGKQMSPDTTTFSAFTVANIYTGIAAGSHSFYITYRGVTAGTTTAQDAAMLVAWFKE